MSDSNFAMENLTGKQMNTIIEKLGGYEGAVMFLYGTFIISRIWKTWLKIKLGRSFESGEDFLTVFHRCGYRTSDFAKSNLYSPGFKVSPETVEVDLILVSVGELGFAHGATKKEIFRRAMELGLDLCPAEVGPQLFLQSHLPKQNREGGASIYVGMNTFSDPHHPDHMIAFRIRRLEDGSRLLDDYRTNLPKVWSTDVKWVFMRRKTQQG